MSKRHIKKIRCKINDTLKEDNDALILFQDEGRFGRINQPQNCWSPQGIRPSIPCQIVREYEHGYAALSPFDGTLLSLVLPYANTACMNIFLKYVSEQFPNRKILMFVDGASYHSSKDLIVPKGIELYPLLAHSPELNPVEVLWKYIREHYFKNELFSSINDVIDRLCDALKNLMFSHQIIESLSAWKWIISDIYI